VRRQIEQQAFPARRFQLWAFSVSHKRLLVRGPKTKEDALNIDLHFGSVEYLDIPTAFTGLHLAAPEPSEIGRVRQMLGPAVDPAHVHILVSGERRHVVVAWTLLVEENDMEYMETPLWSPTEPLAP
jgi:hypothetical protein